METAVIFENQKTKPEMKKTIIQIVIALSMFAIGVGAGISWEKAKRPVTVKKISDKVFYKTFSEKKLHEIELIKTETDSADNNEWRWFRSLDGNVFFVTFNYYARYETGRLARMKCVFMYHAADKRLLDVRIVEQLSPNKFEVLTHVYSGTNKQFLSKHPEIDINGWSLACIVGHKMDYPD
jgi:hypothetical protein